MVIRSWLWRAREFDPARWRRRRAKSTPAQNARTTAMYPSLVLVKIICRTYVSRMLDRSAAPREVVDYIKAIYRLEERGVEVTTTTLAAELRVTPSSVSEMVARLREMGLIS